MRLFVCGVVFVLIGCIDSEGEPLENVGKLVVDKLETLAVETTGGITAKEIILPEKLDDANWGHKATVCKEGGYNLFPFSGQTVNLTSVEIEGNCSGEKIKVWVVSTSEVVACVYLTARENSHIVPGIWSINDEMCDF